MTRELKSRVGRYCSECGHEFLRQLDRCPSCGAASPLACRHCGDLNAAAAKFCGACGATLKVIGSAGDAPVHPSGSSPELYNAQTRLVERKVVTVMFVDMIGSLAAIRDADPEEAHDLFSVALSAMTKAIHEFGGAVVSNTGDGVLAIFGAPLAMADHADRACFAALDLLDRLNHARESRRVLNVRIGLHSGEVAVGTASTDFSLDYGATGAAVHIASRLQSMAPADQAVMSNATLKLLHEKFTTSPLGTTNIRGLKAPIELFVLGPPVPQLPIELNKQAPHFVGRKEELGALKILLDDAMKGRGCVVLLSGEAGAGKTALIERFVSLAPSSVCASRGHVDRYRGAAPFHSFRTLLLGLFGLTNSDATQRIAAISSRIATAGKGETHTKSALLELLEIDSTTAAWRDLDPPTRSEIMTRVILNQLTKESEQHPLLLILEDIQLTDTCSREVIGRLIETVRDKPILMLMTCRTEFEHGWQPSKALSEMRMAGLPQEECQELTRRLIGGNATPTLTRKLFEWSKGNPLFLHEAIKVALDSGSLEDRGTYALFYQPYEQISLPASIRAIIAERIDRLTAPTKEVALAASVLGEAFSANVLSEVLGVSIEFTNSQLEKLQSLEFIKSSPRDKAGEQVFCHPLLQEVCYATILKHRRVAIHAAAFAAIKGLLNKGAAVPVEMLAMHAFRGRLWREAITYCRMAGQRAVSRSAPREASGHFRQALTASQHIEPKSVTAQEAIDIRLELRSTLVQLLQLSAAEDLLKEAHAISRDLGDQNRIAYTTGLLAVHDYLQRGCKGAAELARQSIAIARATNDESGLIVPTICLAQACYGLGQYHEAIKMIEDKLPLFTRCTASKMGLPGQPLTIANYWLAISKAEMGEFDDAVLIARSMGAQASELQIFDAMYAGTAYGFILMVRGDTREALERSKSSLRAAENHDFPYLTPVLASQVGLLLARQGEFAEGIRLGRYAVQTAARIGVFAGRSRWNARLAEICMRKGEWGEARENLDEALDIAERAGELGYLSSALCLQASYLSDFLGDMNNAEAALLRAARIARRLGAKPTLAKCLFQFGKMDLTRGNIDGARRRLEQAIHRFRRHGMTSWQSVAEHELKSLDCSPDHVRPLASPGV